MRTILRLTFAAALLLAVTAVPSAACKRAASSRPQPIHPKPCCSTPRIAIAPPPVCRRFSGTPISPTPRSCTPNAWCSTTRSRTSLPAKLPLQDRARQVGARFSMIAENVAEGPSAQGLHTQWMNSPPHRANLLDQELNSIGIAVIQRGNMFFAVEDFSVGVPQLSFEEQEATVAAQLAGYGLRVENDIPRRAQDLRGGSRLVRAAPAGSSAI